MQKYELVAGIETHVQLRTKTKLFCSCPTTFAAAPNSIVCPVCLGLPGCLPVLNREALNLAIKAALALNCKISNHTKFDRKNYYYPDLPKNYQISQFDMPLANDGFVQIEQNGNLVRIGIQRVHLEEDAGKLIHKEDGSHSLIDLNRTGLPLIEIVTKPDIHSPQEAYLYLTTLKSVMRYIEVSDCDMEKGELRCDINLSVRPAGKKELGIKTEIKNLNSFKFAMKAMEYEFERQVKIIQSGGQIVQETRLFDPKKNITELMRTKEEIHDYRYFPEPDLPPLIISQETIDKIMQGLPELANKRQERFVDQYGLSSYDAGVLVSDKYLGDYFESCVKITNKPKLIANWINNNLLNILNERNLDPDKLKLPAQEFCKLIDYVENSTITALSAKELLNDLLDTAKSVDTLIKEKDLKQLVDEKEIAQMVDRVLHDNPKVIDDIRAGKQTAVKFLVGQVMRLSSGKANPKIVNEILLKKIPR